MNPIAKPRDSAFVGRARGASASTNSGECGCAQLAPNDRYARTAATALPGNSARSFANAKQAANENADSRVMAGIHFKFSCLAGQDLGNKIGKWTVENHLNPVSNH